MAAQLAMRGFNHRPRGVLQHDALHAAGCARVFTDTASGAISDCPQLARVLDTSAPARPSSSGASTASDAHYVTS